MFSKGATVANKVLNYAEYTRVGFLYLTYYSIDCYSRNLVTFALNKRSSEYVTFFKLKSVPQLELF